MAMRERHLPITLDSVPAGGRSKVCATCPHPTVPTQAYFLAIVATVAAAQLGERNTP